MKVNKHIGYIFKGLGIILASVGIAAVIVSLFILLGFLVTMLTWWAGALFCIIIGAYLLGVIAL